VDVLVEPTGSKGSIMKNPKVQVRGNKFHFGEFYYGYRAGSKFDGFYGKLVDHYCTLNNPYSSIYKPYRNYAWVLEKQGALGPIRRSFQQISEKPPVRYRT
jgi:hypothetical protein